MKILFLRGGKTGFNQRDLDFLKSHQEFNVYDSLNFNGKLSKLRSLYRFFESDAVIAWFIGRHSWFYIFLSFFFRKKIVVIAGGYDVAFVPEISYGSMVNPIKKIITILCLKAADMIIAVSKSNKKEIIHNGMANPKKITLISHCLRDEVSSYKLNLKSKRNIALSVGEIRTENLLRKGHRAFAEMSKIDPHNKYILAGRLVDKSALLDLQTISPNLHIITAPNDRELNDLYASAKFYIQFSAHEAFGLSVLEAMHHGCNIIICNNFALTEVVSDSDTHIQNIKMPLVYSTDKAIKNNNRANHYYSKENWLIGMQKIINFINKT